MKQEIIKQNYVAPIMKMVPMIPGQVLCESNSEVKNVEDYYENEGVWEEN